MKCPNCGKEIEDGHLICENCGYEIQIVPDFEPEIENSITETLSTLAALQEEDAGDRAKGDSEEDDTTIVPGQNVPKSKILSETGSNIRLAVSSVAAVFLVLLLCGYMLYNHHITSVSYQIDKAREYAARAQYEQAVSCLDTAYAQDESLVQILFLKADYYYLQGNNTAAVDTLEQIINKGIYDAEDVEDAYDKIITIYSGEESYNEINKLLLTCQNEEIVNRYQGYMAKAPEFSYAEGEYEEVIPLKLNSNTSGTIYYTMDGTMPDEDSYIYTAPLFLDNGTYTVSAFFVNDYGIRSEIVTKTYYVSLEVPNAPEVDIYSGEYTEPMMISVEEQEDCSVYYTTDDSEPTEDSVPYTGPIPMPLGTTNFKFVNISADGVSSEVTNRTYTLRLSGTISTSEAVHRLVDRLVETGYLLDESGHIERQNVTYSYEFSSVLRIGEDTYFTINEYYGDGTGVLNRTDKVFVVQVYTGDAARLGYDEDGNFRAIPLG